MKIWQTPLLALVFAGLCSFALNYYEDSVRQHSRKWGGAVNHPHEVHNKIFDLFAKGDYILIGKKNEGDEGYHGKVRLSRNGDQLLMTRDIGGSKVTATGRISHDLAPDHIHFLHFDYEINTVRYRASYEWSIVHGNVARITGYVERLGKTNRPHAMEALFREQLQL